MAAKVVPVANSSNPLASARNLPGFVPQFSWRDQLKE